MSRPLRLELAGGIAPKDAFMDEMQTLAEADCDEEMLGR